MRLFTITMLMSALAFSLATPANALSPRDQFFNRLQGEWKGEGTAFGGTSRAEAKWDWTLDEKFFRLSLKYETKGRDGMTTTFAGHAYYKSSGSAAYDGQWFDSNGNQYPIKAQLEGDTLTALWGIAGKLEGKSIYRLAESDKVFEVTDFIKQKDGSWREFSRFKLRRV